MVCACNSSAQLQANLACISPLARRAGGSGHIKPVLALFQAATFLVHFLSSIATAADCFQVIVILLPALHHMNKVAEMVPGVRHKILT